MGYQINSVWTRLRKDDIERLNEIIDDEYCVEQEIGRKLNLMNKLTEAFDEELNRFNFDAVLSFMNGHDWKWAFYEDSKSFYKVPDKDDIIKTLKTDFLKHALYDIIERGKTEAGTESGGLVLNIGIDGNDVWCRIYFDIAHFISNEH